MNGTSHARTIRCPNRIRFIASFGMLGIMTAPALASEFPQSHELPTPTGNMTLSPSGPYISSSATPEPPATPYLTNRGSDTYTYLRCWYRISDNPLKPGGTYIWARNPGNGDWYRVPGYWWADGITQWKNMFYSATSQETLLDVCRKTLDSHGIQRDVTQALAANNQFSFNYTVWTFDSPQQDHRINKLIVFGDSLSDTQNMFNASQWKLPNDSSWHMGRFSDGPVWVEYLAKTLDLPMYNWAIGGAATDQYLVVPGLLQQVKSWWEYMDRAPDYRPENTLFTVLTGGNDLVNYRRSPKQAARAVSDSLNKLAQSGAKHIVLLNLPDVSRAPVFSTRNDAARVAREVRMFNELLIGVVAELRAYYGETLNVEIFDAYTLFDDLMTNPERYGFDDATHSCLDIRNPTSLSYIRSQTPRADCRDPGRFVFWDTLHPSTRTHAWLALKLAKHIREFVKH